MYQVAYELGANLSFINFAGKTGTAANRTTVEPVITHTPRSLADRAGLSHFLIKTTPEHSHKYVLHDCQLFMGIRWLCVVVHVEQ
jgi:hypothetical protein